MKWKEIKSVTKQNRSYQKNHDTVVDVVAFEIPELLDSERLARLALQNGIRMLRKRGILPTGIAMNIKGKKPMGCLISFEDFIGPGYNFTEHTLHLYSYNGSSTSTRVDYGLAYALLNPPHGINLQLPQKKPSYKRVEEAKCNLIRNYLQEVLGITDSSDLSEYIFMNWSADWSGYFRDGHEWWGSFCWTVQITNENKIISLYASDTD